MVVCVGSVSVCSCAVQPVSTQQATIETSYSASLRHRREGGREGNIANNDAATAHHTNQGKARQGRERQHARTTMAATPSMHRMTQWRNGCGCGCCCVVFSSTPAAVVSRRANAMLLLLSSLPRAMVTSLAGLTIMAPAPQQQQREESSPPCLLFRLPPWLASSSAGAPPPPAGAATGAVPGSAPGGGGAAAAADGLAGFSG